MDYGRRIGAIVDVADRNTDALDADAHFPGDLTNKHYTDTLAQTVSDALTAVNLTILCLLIKYAPHPNPSIWQ